MADDLEVTDPEELAMSDLLNRVLDRGLVISGNVIVSVADVDLIEIDLRLLVSAVESMLDRERRKAREAR